MVTIASIEVFQDLAVLRGDLSHSTVRDALLAEATDLWAHAGDKEALAKKYMTNLEDVIAFERESRGDVPAIAMMLWERADGYYVSNIVPQQTGQLTIGQYNAVLQDFEAEVARPASQKVGFWVKATGSRQSLEDWMSAETAKRLLTFSRCANKSTGASHPLDRERWLAFVISSHRDGLEVQGYLSRWLIEAEHWPEEIAHRLAIQYEQGLELLKKYDQHQ
jgi:hypothetical protein